MDMMSKSKLDRRGFLAAILGFVGLAALPRLLMKPVFASEAKVAPFTLSEAQWRERLTPGQYGILRQSGTEAAFTSPLLHEKRDGIFACAGCAHDLFSSKAKFDSGTGWPSFWQPINTDAIRTSGDNSLFMSRTEVHCENCAGHLGHVFDDGPKPTGLRYCMNGEAMTFKAAA